MTNITLTERLKDLEKHLISFNDSYAAEVCFRAYNKIDELERKMRTLKYMTAFLDASQTEHGEHCTRIDILGDFTNLDEAIDSVLLPEGF